MPTYSKETALYDTGTIAAGIDAAGNTADTYITAVGNNGIKVHAANNVNTNYASIDATGMEVVRGGTSMAKFGETTRIGEADANRIELDEDGLVQYTEDGVVGIRAGLSSTNHTVDVTHTPARRMTGDVYWYKWYNSDSYSSHSITAEYPFTSDSPSTIDKFILHLSLYGAIGAKYDIAVPFASDFTYQVPDTTFYVRWTASTQTLSVRKETPDQQNAQGGGYTTLVVTYTNYVIAESAHSPVLLFGEHSTMSAPGLYAVALGQESTSEGDNALTAGIATAAASEAQTAIGKYNDNDSDNAFEVGNGTADDARSNAFAVGWDGTVTTARDILVTSTSGMSGIITAGSGITIDIFKFCQRSNVASILLRAKKSTVTAANTAISVGTVVADRRPPFECAGPGTSGVGDCWVDDTGSVKFRSTSQIAANANFYVRVTYPVA